MIPRRILLDTDPLASLVGMLLDQQVPMEWAFASPLKLKERLGGTLDAATIAAMPLEELEAVFKGHLHSTASRDRWPSAPSSCASTSSITTADEQRLCGTA